MDCENMPTESCNVTEATKHETKQMEDLSKTNVPNGQLPETSDVDKDPAFVRRFKILVHDNKNVIKQTIKYCLLTLYLVYFGFAVRHSELTIWTEDSWRLVWVTCVLVWVILNNRLSTTNVYLKMKKVLKNGFNHVKSGKTGNIVRLFFYVAMTGFMVVYVIVAVAMKRLENLQSLIGLFVFPFLLFLYSNNKRKVNWHTVFWGMSIQFVMALIVLKTVWGAKVIRWVADRFLEFVDVGSAGSIFLFGDDYKDHRFAFETTMQMMALLVGISVLRYIGVIDYIVNTLGRGLAFCLQTSRPESICCITNIFLFVAESAMFIQEYLADMTPSQLFVTYTGGLATVSGAALVVFMGYGIDPVSLIAASVMSAPAALATSKLVFPTTDDELVPSGGEGADEKNQTPGRSSLLRKPHSLVDSIVLGIQQSITIIVQVCAYMATFLMILEFANRTFTWFGNRVGINNLTLEMILSYLFYPASFMLGAPAKDCLIVGEMLGIRTVSIALIAFPKFSVIVQNGRDFRAYVAENENNTWTTVGRDVILVNGNITLEGGIIEKRSEIIAIYALCGSASIAIMGYILGIFSAVIPSRLDEIAKHMLRSMIAGTVASYMTACFAGLLYEDLDV